MSHREFARSLTEAAIHAGDVAADSAVTIAARLPVFAQCFLSPNAAGMQEMSTAVSEKINAGWDGIIAAGFAWQQVMIKSVFNPPNPVVFATDMVQVFGEAGGPARKSVRANALRLGSTRG